MQQENSQRALSGKGRYIVFVGGGARTRDATGQTKVMNQLLAFATLRERRIPGVQLTRKDARPRGTLIEL